MDVVMKTEDIMNSRLMRAMGTKVVRHVEKPKPLKPVNQVLPSRHSMPDVPGTGKYVASIVEELMNGVETLVSLINTKNYSEISSRSYVITNKLRIFGIQLEEYYKDQLDRAFISFRDASMDSNIDQSTRISLLEMIELRAMHWQTRTGSFGTYYTTRQINEGGNEPVESQYTPTSPAPVVHLGPGEVIKPSGKYPAPTKMTGKSYCKDEVIIRNADSGKVMGIKGRRVHMIEELSETVISFQRVNPGAKERLVQITGPTEDKIMLARNLIEDTIKRNASPVRELPERDFHVGSSSSLNSSASDEAINCRPEVHDGPGDMDHSMSYRHTLYVNGSRLYIASDNYNLISIAKLNLDSLTHERGGKKPNTKKIDAGVQVNKCCNVSMLGGKADQIPKRDSTKATSPTSSNSWGPPPIERRDGPRREYTRLFLLDCAKSPASTSPPKCLNDIAMRVPFIVKQSAPYFDINVYMKKWKDLEGRHSSIVAGFSDSE